MMCVLLLLVVVFVYDLVKYTKFGEKYLQCSGKSRRCINNIYTKPVNPVLDLCDYHTLVRNILFPIKVNLENERKLYIACMNPTNVVLVIIFGIIIGKGA